MEGSLKHSTHPVRASFLWFIIQWSSTLTNMIVTRMISLIFETVAERKLKRVQTLLAFESFFFKLGCRLTVQSPATVRVCPVRRARCVHIHVFGHFWIWSEDLLVPPPVNREVTRDIRAKAVLKVIVNSDLWSQELNSLHEDDLRWSCRKWVCTFDGRWFDIRPTWDG